MAEAEVWIAAGGSFFSDDFVAIPHWIPAPAFAGVTFFRRNDEKVCRLNVNTITGSAAVDKG